METIKPTLSYLKQRGLLPILNYAVEDDVKHAEDKGTSAGLADIEAKPNANACIFMQSIADCDNTTPSRGFVSAKVCFASPSNTNTGIAIWTYPLTLNTLLALSFSVL